jgi:hypothetical protein
MMACPVLLFLIDTAVWLEASHIDRIGVALSAHFGSLNFLWNSGVRIVGKTLAHCSVDVLSQGQVGVASVAVGARHAYAGMNTLLKIRNDLDACFIEKVCVSMTGCARVLRIDFQGKDQNSYE